MTGEHYFSGTPTGPDRRSTLTVELDGARREVQVSSGVFSGGRLDPGTAVLLREVPRAVGATMLDLGCGWGPIALTMALQAPDAQVWAVDVNERALDLTAANARSLGCANVRPALPTDVPEDLRFDLIWSNPPIRVGKQILHELMSTWLPRLAVRGVAELVVQKNLGADSLQTWLVDALAEHGEFSVTRTASSKGFRILTIRREA